MKTSNEERMKELQNIVKRKFKEEGDIEVSAFSFWSEKNSDCGFTLVENKETGECGVIFPSSFKNMDLTGVDLEAMAKDFRFKWGYRIKDLLKND